MTEGEYERVKEKTAVCHGEVVRNTECVYVWCVSKEL